MSKKIRRAVNFDLSIDQLKQFYSQANPKGAYKVIEDYFVEKKFIHRQYLGYVSEKQLTDSQIISVMNDFYKQFPWLDKCATRMDITNVGQIYDFKELRNENKEICKNKSQKIELKLEKSKKCDFGKGFYMGTIQRRNESRNTVKTMAKKYQREGLYLNEIIEKERKKEKQRGGYKI